MWETLNVNFHTTLFLQLDSDHSPTPKSYCAWMLLQRVEKAKRFRTCGYRAARCSSLPKLPSAEHSRVVHFIARHRRRHCALRHYYLSVLLLSVILLVMCCPCSRYATFRQDWGLLQFSSASVTDLRTLEMVRGYKVDTSIESPATQMSRSVSCSIFLITWRKWSSGRVDKLDLWC